MAEEFVNIPNSGSPRWKSPVATAADLPATANVNGDVRVALDTSDVYEWNGSSWVLIAGATAAAAFGVIQAPNGTNPVADIPHDTLTLSSSDSTVTITGDSSTDTVSFIARVASVSQSGIVSLGTQTLGTGTKTVESLVSTRRILSGVSTLTDGTTVALNASLGNTFVLSSVQNPTISIPTNASNGQKITIIFHATSADRTLSLTTGSSGAFAFGTEIAALSPTTANTNDFIGCIYSTLNSRWNVVAYVKGY